MLIEIMTAVDIAVLVLCLFLLREKRADRLVVRAFLKGLHPLPMTGLQCALYLATAVFLLPRRPDLVIWASVFRTLGARPSDVVKFGGCCAGKGRLLIVLLKEMNIHAYQVGLYHTSGRAQHCLVEVCLSDGRLIVDPTYGVYYTAADGRPMSYRELQHGVVPAHVPLLEDSGCGYPRNSYYDFCYVNSKTLNWTKSLPRRALYPLLRYITQGRIDRLAVPAFFEWPEHLLVALGFLMVMTITVAIGVIASTRSSGSFF